MEGFKLGTAIDGREGLPLRLALAGILLFIIIVLTTGGSAQAYTAAGPKYTSGDHWDYTLTANYTYAFNGTSVDIHVRGNRSVRVSGVSGGNATMVEVSKVKATGSFSFQTLSESIVAEVNTTRTIAPASSDGVLFINVTLGYGYASLTERLRGTVSTTVLGNTLQYPLESGHRYRTVSRTLFALALVPGSPPFTASENTTTEYVAGASESVAVKAGTFTALPLASWTNLSGGSVGGTPIPPGVGNGSLVRTYYAPDAGNNVETVTYDAYGQEAAREELVAYSYANGPSRFLQVLSEPVFWIGSAAAVAAVVVAGALIIRRRRAPALPPPPTDTPTLGGVEGSPPAVAPPPEGLAPGVPGPGQPPGQPPEGEEEPPSGPP